MADIVVVAAGQPDPSLVERAAAILRTGGLVIYPTDTLYALGARALDGAAAAAVRAAKGRDEGKPLPLIAGDTAQARALAAAWPESARRLADAYWPGPLTLVVTAAPEVPPQVTSGTATVAVRVPGLALPRLLALDAGPLISTSANLSGQPPPVTCAQALAQVGAAVALALDGGLGYPMPSTIVDLTAGEPSLVRAGAVPWEQVRRLLS
jgi:L-threonylcarbamoyladenylate synthase